MFNQALDDHYPWNTKRVTRKNQAPWMTKAVIKQLRNRDHILKRARLSNNDADWKNYKTARNQAVNLIKSTKLKFYHNCFEDNKSNSKTIWKTTKSISGERNKENVKGCVVDDGKSKAPEKFNNHFVSVAEKLRSFLSQVRVDFS